MHPAWHGTSLSLSEVLEAGTKRTQGKAKVRGQMIHKRHTVQGGGGGEQELAKQLTSPFRSFAACLTSR
jgi:hypothetical protein